MDLNTIIWLAAMVIMAAILFVACLRADSAGDETTYTLPLSTSREGEEWQRTALLLVILDQQAQAEIRQQSGLRNARKAARLN